MSSPLKVDTTKRDISVWAEKNAATLVTRQLTPEELAAKRAEPAGVVRPYSMKLTPHRTYVPASAFTKTR